MFRTFAWGVLAAMIVATPPCLRPSTRIATFNIQDFPRDERQVVGAFAVIRALDAPVVAIQEVSRPAALSDAARRELGPSWRALTSDVAEAHRLGLLYDADRYSLVDVRTRHETRVVAGAKPTLEVQLRPLAGGPVLRVLVVHLKAGGAEHAPTRARQLTALAGIATSDLHDLVVLGDFNATTPADRVAIGEFAAATGLGWASSELGCTAYWPTPAGCGSGALDHVLARRSGAVVARGPCEDVGCMPGDRCPVFWREVSDHCPVTVDLR